MSYEGQRIPKDMDLDDLADALRKPQQRKRVRLAISYTITNPETPPKSLLSAWNRKFVVMQDEAGVESVSKFRLETPSRSGRLMCDVVYDARLTDERKVLAHFNNHKKAMLPKYNYPSRRKYTVGEVFMLDGQPEDFVP